MWREPETVPEMLKRNVLDFRDREAFVSVLYRTGQWVRHTWREIDRISDQVATGFYNLGIRKGQRVAFQGGLSGAGRPELAQMGSSQTRGGKDDTFHRAGTY
jgi:long-subunit acyl-CoA synthetase (AMP-forming)